MQIDVVFLSFNQRCYLNQALDSLFMQEVAANVRVIVADDASTDGSMDIIRKEAQKSPFEVVYLSNIKNIGISKNYQRALASCTGDYIAVLEGDDYWTSPHHIQQHLDFLENHKDCSMSMNNITRLDEKTGTFQCDRWNCEQPSYLVSVKEQIEKGNQLGNMSACVLRTSCVKKLPQELFELSIADWMLGVMMAQYGPIGILKESTSVYRVKDSGVWAGQNLWRQHFAMLHDARVYDKFQQGKYHKEWQHFKRGCWRNVRRNWMHYMPGFVQKFSRKLKKTYKNKANNN
jgi:glycosyltransferase involved in cell wall biosynthesis